LGGRTTTFVGVVAPYASRPDGGLYLGAVDYLAALTGGVGVVIVVDYGA